MKDLFPKDIAQLEAWWNQSLPEMERIRLEERLKTDPEFRLAADKLRQTLNTLYDLQRETWRKNSPRFDRSAFPAKPPLLLRVSKSWLFWASIVAFLLLGSYLVKKVVVVEKSKLIQASKEFSPPDWLPYQQGSQADELLDSASKAYLNSRYRRASRKLEQYLALEPADIEAKLMLVVAYLKQGEGNKAWQLLQDLEKKGEYPEQLSWYKALALIQRKQEDAAKPLLRQVAKENNPWRTEARRLLEQF